MKARIILLAPLALALASTACQPPVQEAGPLSEEDMAAIRNLAEQEWVQALLTGDAAAAAATHTEDAVRLPPNVPVIRGRADIEASLAGLSVTEFAQTLEEVDGRGDLAYARGTYEFTGTLPGVPESVVDQGKWLIIMQKQPDGTWLVSTSIYNSDLPLPEEGSGT